jgi:hypothetical protein
MTVYQSLLTRGYFPKELPPAFFTESFAKFATTKTGRIAVSSYVPANKYTECVKYQLAQPGFDRELRIPHPATFAKLAELTAKNFGRLLRSASRSLFSKSRPIYSTGHHRAIWPMVRPTNLSREPATIRAGSSYLLKADISQFYPSLYTHAVGWAVDPKLRNRANWNNTGLLGRKLDQALMDLDGKVSQGVPIGNDISFLLSEVVLAQVDKAIRLDSSRAFRWFDDYEFAVDSRDQAETTLKKLKKELGRFRLRLNQNKTRVMQLPRPSQDEWQEALRQAGTVRFANPHEMVRYFDTAFRLREQFPDAAVLLYALGTLFKISCPAPHVSRIAQSCITQTLLCEPGAAQKAFALLSFWRLNGLALDEALITRAINQIIMRHQASGFSSDVAWALAFCLEQRCSLNPKAARVLSEFDDDCIALQALHMHCDGLLPNGFNNKRISKALKQVDLDREHWLLAYETVRQGFLPVCATAVKSNPLFSKLLQHKVTFYRRKLPLYSTIIHPGGAPEWVVRKWMGLLTGPAVEQAPERSLDSPLLRMISEDLAKLERVPSSSDDAIRDLLDTFIPPGAVPLEDVGDDDVYPA